MAWGAIAGAAVGLVGSYLSSQNSADAASSAAQAQENAANQSNATLMKMYDQSRSDLAPWRTTGASALNQLAALNGLQGTNAQGGTTNPGAPDYSSFFASPDYKFTLQQGINALDASAAARGRLYSGGYGQDLTNYAQGLASTQLNNYENRLMGLSGQGQQAGEFGGQMAMNTAMGYGNNLMNGANAAANGYFNQANAQNGFINQFGQLAGYGLNAWMNPTTQNNVTAQQPSMSSGYSYGDEQPINWSAPQVQPTWWTGQ